MMIKRSGVFLGFVVVLLSASIAAAQEKVKPTTTVDAWRDAVPSSSEGQLIDTTVPETGTSVASV
jgi:hypothetical protein